MVIVLYQHHLRAYQLRSMVIIELKFNWQQKAILKDSELKYSKQSSNLHSIKKELLH